MSIRREGVEHAVGADGTSACGHDTYGWVIRGEWVAGCKNCTLAVEAGRKVTLTQ
jgi:hypothetical protein